MSPFTLRALPWSIAMAFPALSFVASPVMAVDGPSPSITLSPVVVVETKPVDPLAGTTLLGGSGLARKRAATSDTAGLLGDVPGLSLFGAGGVSSLPTLHGLADDRLRIKVDGMDLISACANHMNPPLSYIDPSNVGSIEVFGGITPVSAGAARVCAAWAGQPAEGAGGHVLPQQRQWSGYQPVLAGSWRECEPEFRRIHRAVRQL